MQKRVLAVLVLLCLFIPATVGARSLVNVSLGFGASYSPGEEIDLSQGMADPNNWLFNGEISARLAFLQAQALVFPIECEDNGQGIRLVGLGALSLPVVGSLLSVEIGGGVSVIYVPSNGEETQPYYILADGSKAKSVDTSFGEAVWESPIYLQAGLATEMGPVGVRLRYLIETRARVKDIVDGSRWYHMFNVETGALSLVLSLKMF
jgi:hypothetical protein